MKNVKLHLSNFLVFPRARHTTSTSHCLKQKSAWCKRQIFIFVCLHPLNAAWWSVDTVRVYKAEGLEFEPRVVRWFVRDRCLNCTQHQFILSFKVHWPDLSRLVWSLNIYSHIHVASTIFNNNYMKCTYENTWWSNHTNRCWNIGIDIFHF